MSVSIQQVFLTTLTIDCICKRKVLHWHKSFWTNINGTKSDVTEVDLGLFGQHCIHPSLVSSLWKYFHGVLASKLGKLPSSKYTSQNWSANRLALLRSETALIVSASLIRTHACFVSLSLLFWRRQKPCFLHEFILSFSIWSLYSVSLREFFFWEIFVFFQSWEEFDLQTLLKRHVRWSSIFCK